MPESFNCNMLHSMSSMKKVSIKMHSYMVIRMKRLYGITSLFSTQGGIKSNTSLKNAIYGLKQSV